MNKFSKKQLIDAIKNMKTKETNIIRQNGEIEIMAKGDEIETLPSKEITLKSIYNLMTTKFESIDNRFDSIDTRLSSLEAKVTDLDIKLNKVIELNKDIINLNKLKVSKENKTWLFSNHGDDNTPSR